MEFEQSIQNKGFSLRFCVGSQVWHEIPGERQRIYWLKHCGYKDEDKDDNLNIQRDKNWLF